MKKLGAMLLAGTILNCGLACADDECSAIPDCAKLGYTQDASLCGGAALYCPWDLSKASCKEKSPRPILYGDGTISNIIMSNKKPIGIVFDEKNKLAIALTDIHWGGKPKQIDMASVYLNCMVPLQICSEDKLETCDVDGRDNTDVLLRIHRPGAAVAPRFVNWYEPAGCSSAFCKKGKWFIPSARDLINVRKLYADIKKSLILLSDLGGEKLNDLYWSSTGGRIADGYMNKYLWKIYVNKESQYDTYMENGSYIRPVIHYGEEIKKADVSIPCVLGALLGGDGKCYTTKLNSGVSVVGVVFDTDKRLAAALTDVKKDGSAGSQRMAWATGAATNNYYDTAAANCDSSTLKTCGADGRVNTTNILKATKGGTYEAAQAVNKYEPAGCTAAFCKKTKWFLPSYSEMSDLAAEEELFHNAFNLISGLTATELQFNATFNSLGGYYWTSTESSDRRAWDRNNALGAGNYKDKQYFVRPVVKY